MPLTRWSLRRAAALALCAAFLAPSPPSGRSTPPGKPSPPPGRSTPAALLAAQLKAAISGSPAPAPGKCIEIQYEGVLELEGHFRTPGEKQPYRSRQRFLSNGQGAVRLDWTTWIQGDSAGGPESWMLLPAGAGGTLLYRSAPGSPWREIGAERREQALAQVTAGFPWEVARAAGASAATARARVTGGGPGGVWFLSDNRPGSGALTLRPIDGAVISYMTTRPHPRLGDVRDGVLYAYGEPGLVPTEMRQIVHERDMQWSMAERRVSFRTDAPDSLASPPGYDPPEPADSMRAEVKLAPLAPGLWSADLDDLDTRTLVVEFADKLAVLEAAVGSENGERIADAAKRQFPNKPIRYFLFSHYHPHYAGGLRAFVAEGATVVTTPGNEHFVRQMSDLAFTLHPDRLARAKRPLSMQTFAKRFDLADSTNRLVAVNIGPRSDHTNEFVVFWFPKQRMLFETEQGWVTVDGKTRASRRAERFLKALDDEGLAADRIVQSWPMRGNPAMLTRVELDSLVTLRGRTLPQATAGVKP
ncbi:MAG TPA: hypothetical protein VE326_06405 [Candidatus Binatia bacterium]|nr:hypothetical protein [Candidatus Binatia bacterium]